MVCDALQAAKLQNRERVINELHDMALVAVPNRILDPINVKTKMEKNSG